MSSLPNHQAKLDAAWRLLQQRWEATGEVWTDRVHDAFAAQYIEPLAQQTQGTQRALEQLARLVAKVEQAVK